MLEKEYIISNLQFKQTKHGKEFVSLTLTSNDSDKLELDGKVWAENVDKLKAKLQNGYIIKIVDGKQDTYNNMPQINILDIKVTGKKEWGLSLENATERYNEILNFIEKNITNEQAKAITLQTLKKYSKNPVFFQSPAAKSHHHNYPGGLVQHTLELCKLAYAIKNTGLYPSIGWDIVFSACVLHDLGKIYDYTIQSGTIEITPAMKLTGHLVTTPLEIFDTAKNLGLEYTPVFDNILHAVVAHHGRKEYGSPQTPETPEAWIVHLVDMISSRVADSNSFFDGEEPTQTTLKLF
jgi:3'-5' exoribonuclease